MLLYTVLRSWQLKTYHHSCTEGFEKNIKSFAAKMIILQVLLQDIMITINEAFRNVLE